ncbi:MAG TPA: hypothetical protein VNI57_15755 [Candidatus Saccharimonadales bacterium]|nr:hypothetical protein [Candidatus Saccharimonadales bacterium]
MSILGFVGEIFFEDKVVAHYKDGSVVKGHTRDFDPGKDEFTLHPYEAGGEAVAVEIESLKAVFHVKTFEGNPAHPPPSETITDIEEPRFRDVMRGGRKAYLEFADGERMWGYAEGFESARGGFFLFPTDPEGNNLRVYVVRSALKNAVLIDR